MKKILLGILLGWCAHWAWSGIELDVKVKSPRISAIKHKLIAVAKPTPSCTKVEVKEPTAEQLVALGILKG